MAENEKEIARFFDCCEPSGQRRANRRLSAKARRDLIAGLRDAGVSGKTVLEIGCGPGDLVRELISLGASYAMGVDLAEKTLEEARLKTEDAGLSDRINFSVGNGAKDALERHDIVVLDKVICCYPDWQGLVGNTSGAATSVYGFVIPRSFGFGSGITKTILALGNFMLRLRKCGFRAFVHDYKAIDQRLRELGFTRLSHSPGPIWMAAVYARA